MSLKPGKWITVEIISLNYLCGWSFQRKYAEEEEWEKYLFHTVTVGGSEGRPKLWSRNCFADFRGFLLRNNKRGFCFSVTLVMSCTSTALPVLLIVFLFWWEITIRLHQNVHQSSTMLLRILFQTDCTVPLL